MSISVSNNACTQKILLDWAMPITVQFRRWNKWYLNLKKSLQSENIALIKWELVDQFAYLPSDFALFAATTTSTFLLIKKVRYN